MNERFGVDLQPTVTFDYPTLPTLAAHIAKLAAPKAEVGTQRVPAVAPLPTIDLDDLR